MWYSGFPEMTQQLPSCLYFLSWRHTVNIVENIEPMAEDVSLWSSDHVSTAEHSSGILRGVSGPNGM